MTRLRPGLYQKGSLIIICSSAQVYSTLKMVPQKGEMSSTPPDCHCSQLCLLRSRQMPLHTHALQRGTCHPAHRTPPLQPGYVLQ